MSVDLRKVNRRVIESLIKAGAFDEIEKNRASLLASIGLAINFADQTNANLGQNNLFEASEEQAVELVSVESWDTQKQLLEEKEALGFYFSGHPFTYYKKMIREFIPTKLSASAVNDKAPKDWPAEPLNFNSKKFSSNFSKSKSASFL